MRSGSRENKNLGAVQGRERDEVEHPQTHAEHRDLDEQREEVGIELDGDDLFQGEVIEQAGAAQCRPAHEEVAQGASQGGDRHAGFGVAEVAHIHRHRLGPAEPGGDQQDETQRVDVVQRVHGHSALALCRLVPQAPGGEAVAHLVEADAQEGGDGLDEQGDQLCQVEMFQKGRYCVHFLTPIQKVLHFIIPELEWKRQPQTWKKPTLFHNSVGFGLDI